MFKAKGHEAKPLLLLDVHLLSFVFLSVLELKLGALSCYATALPLN